MALDQPAGDAPAVLDCLATAGWCRHDRGGATIQLRGYVDPGTLTALWRALTERPNDAQGALGAVLAETNGHYALIATGPGWTLAAVDPVRSTPLFFADVAGTWRIDDQAERLRRRAGFGPPDVDPEAALAIAMAGYTIDRATLYRGLHMLGPGECALFRHGRAPERLRYHCYRPWRVVARDPATLERDLEEITLDIMRRLLASLDGRTLAVPLSAGNDSRLIVGAAKHLGYKNVRCFAYGRADGFEARTSRAIAECLGYPWAFVPYTIAGHRRYFASALHAAYLAASDSCASVPFEQDLPALLALKDAGFIPADAVIANGNSGDYISGNHIPRALATPPTQLDHAARRRDILAALSAKHFALWRVLRTPDRIDRVEAALWRSIESAGGALEDPAGDHGLYEYAEFQDRQCKYVITGQRIYEFLGHEWRLPLWDTAYLRFWESVPLEQKAGQALYRRMLRAADWGGVWRDIPVNRKTIRPRWLIPFRLAAKVAHAPLGQQRWHEFERRFFLYWMDANCSNAAVPYLRVACDRRGSRSGVSWLTEDYLRTKGLSLDHAGAA